MNCGFIADFAVLDDLKYASSHEWVKHDGPVATIGITDHAQVSFSLFLNHINSELLRMYYVCIQEHLGELVFVELPEPGKEVKQGTGFGAVESVKATSDVNSPISGEVVEINSKLADSPGLVSNSYSLIQSINLLSHHTCPGHDLKKMMFSKLK